LSIFLQSCTPEQLHLSPNIFPLLKSYLEAAGQTISRTSKPIISSAMKRECNWVPADHTQYEALKKAVVDGDVQRVAAALKSELDVNAMYGDGFEGDTVLHKGAWLGHVDVIRYLLAHGAEVDVRNRDQFGNGTPLFSAARAGHVEAVRVLLDAGADMNATEVEDETILTVPLWDDRKWSQGHADTIVLLLDRGADINARRGPDWGPTIVSRTCSNH
jgi:Ankyrin repeats (3 copies)